MGESAKRSLQLRLEARAEFLPVVTQFVEAAGNVFGLERTKNLKLSLAAEEIFLYLGNGVCPAKPLEITGLNGLYYTRISFRFQAQELNLRGLNITSSPASEGSCDLEQMGLMLASRSVDHLHLTQEAANWINLAVTKRKSYPRISESFPRPEAPGKAVLETTDPERIKRFALMAGHLCAGPDLPPFFDTPGEVADMVAGGEYQCLTAVNRDGQIVGGILFSERSERIVQFFGPYLFPEGEQAATGEALLDALIARIARTKVLGLLSLSGLPETLQSRFELLGSLTCRGEDRPPAARPFFFRHLHEDPGGEVWSAGEMTAWLMGEYDRLVLAREIRTVRDMGETRAGSSLLAAEISRERAEATLRPLWPGADLAANMAEQVRCLKGDGLHNLLVEVDLGIPWHAELIPTLLSQGFEPVLLLPFAGRADLVVFEHHDATES